MFKLGDEVRTSNGSEWRCTTIYSGERQNWVMTKKGNTTTWPVGNYWTGKMQNEAGYTIIKNNNKTIMSIKSVWKNITRKEPERSFVKAGITNDNDELTTDGKDLFIGWLLEKNKDLFNTEVVQPILAEQEKE